MALWKNTDTENSKPSFLSEKDKEKVVFVDITEASTQSNREKGLKTPGWVKYETYTDSNGNTRHKSEVLVAVSKTAVGAGDSNDDHIVGDVSFKITTQPVNTSVEEPEVATFTVVAEGTNQVFQWQVKSGSSFVDIVDDEVYSGADTDTLEVISSVDLNGAKFRVKVTNEAGTTIATSKTVTLTVTSE